MAAAHDDHVPPAVTGLRLIDEPCLRASLTGTSGYLPARPAPTPTGRRASPRVLARRPSRSDPHATSTGRSIGINRPFLGGPVERTGVGRGAALRRRRAGQRGLRRLPTRVSWPLTGNERAPVRPALKDPGLVETRLQPRDAPILGGGRQTTQRGRQPPPTAPADQNRPPSRTGTLNGGPCSTSAYSPGPSPSA